ncbi:MAG: DUF4268 domain-containing protein [Acidimicrobiaceae bacterium]|nr:DUF4268 domain-containing protein [Acidimicrobiaceae bacterium]
MAETTKPPNPSESPRSGIGLLETVPIRELWPHEALDLTPWLAENPAVIGNCLGLNLSLEGTEVSVGSYSADLVFTDTERACRVVVENMYGSTDHDHIGKLITYAAGLEATHAVLLAEGFRPEHLSALIWLNEVSRTPFGFFGLVLEAWRIDGSRPAPHLRVELEPDEWSRSVRDARTSHLSNSQAICLEFWGDVQQALQQSDSRWAASRRPSKNPWMTFDRKNNVCYNAAFHGRGTKRSLRAEVWIDASDKAATAAIYEALLLRRESIEGQLGYELTWEPEVHGKNARISVSHPGPASENDRAGWPEAQQWLVHALFEFRDAFDPVLERMARERTS